jgi:hypothetical protein
VPVHLPPGSPVTDRPHTQPVEGLQATVDVLRLGLGRDALHRLVQVAVVSDLVSGIDDLPDHVRIGVGGEAGHEEGRRHLLPLQQSQ